MREFLPTCPWPLTLLGTSRYSTAKVAYSAERTSYGTEVQNSESKNNESLAHSSLPEPESAFDTAGVPADVNVDTGSLISLFLIVGLVI